MMTNKDYKRLTIWNEKLQRAVMTMDGNNETVADMMKRYVSRLYELENAIENGTLVFLPCKTGQEFWWIYHSPVGTEKSVESETVCKVEIFNNNITILTDSGLLFNVKDIFTSKEAAKKALQEACDDK